MSDIDKDIETLKKVQGIFEHLKTHGWINDIKRDVDTDTVILSIENVLNELENLQEDLKIHEETSFDFQAENIKLREELEETIKELNEKEIVNKMFKSELEIKDKMIEDLNVDKIELKAELGIYSVTVEQLKQNVETYKKMVEKINNLEALEQYAIDRDLFVEIFRPIDEFIWDNYDYESDDFKFWGYIDEYYILHKPSGTLVNWYKHLGRTNTCNKILSEEEYKTFVEMFTADWREKR